MKKEDYNFQEVEAIKCEKDFGETFYQCNVKMKDGSSEKVRVHEIISNGGDGMAAHSFKYEGDRKIEKDFVSIWQFHDSDNTLYCNLIHGHTLECESKDLLKF